MYFISELLMYKDLECMKCSRDIKCSFVFAAESVMGIYSIKTISHMLDIAWSADRDFCLLSQNKLFCKKV